jgi:hypothetical protein
MHPAIQNLPRSVASDFAERAKSSCIVMRNTIILIAACAISTWVTAQNGLKNDLKSDLKGDLEQCIPANTFHPLPEALVGTQDAGYGKTQVALGSYERISPDGRFVLRSFSGGRLGDVSLIELDAQGQPIAAYDTPLSNEAFPVQGTWRYIVDVNGDHYSFSSLLRSKDVGYQGKKPIKPLFRGGMTGFYAAASELPVAEPGAAQPALPAGQVRIRSMSWPNPGGNVDTQGQGALVARDITIDTAQQRIVADSGYVHLCTQRVSQDGPLYALPMISVDGLEFAALPQTPVQGQPTMRIYAFGDDLGRSKNNCQPRDAFAFASGKTIFGYPQGQEPAGLAYEYRSQVWWYQRSADPHSTAQNSLAQNTIAQNRLAQNSAQPLADPQSGRRFNIAPYYANPRTELFASAFPGITRDGRVIYGATLKECSADANQPCTERAGYMVTDPYQSNAYQEFLRQVKGPARRQCITQGDVARVRANFAQMHGLTMP